MSKDDGISWMYEGAKSDVNREDYLLGKKVDKNFEKYSDVVNKQKKDVIDSIVSTRTVYGAERSTGVKTSSLQKDIIKSEDPFVAVKVREETKRRELMDNPLMKKRMEKRAMKTKNLLKTMMMSKRGKEKEKKSKKDKKKKKKRSRSASSRDSSEERLKKESQRRRSPSPKEKRRSSEWEEDVRKRTDSSSSRRKEERLKRRSRSRSVEKSSRNRSRSPRRDRSDFRNEQIRRRVSRSPRRQRSRSRSEDHSRRRSTSPRGNQSRSRERIHRSPRRSRDNGRKTRGKSVSRSRSGEKPSSSNPKSSRQFDSHIPQHLQVNKGGSGSESESEDEAVPLRRRRDSDDEKVEPKSYGLVEMRKRTAEEREAEAKEPSKEYKLVKLPTGRGNNKREPRRTLTEEEKAARLAEMQENVKWRDDVRMKNVERTQAEDKEEKEETDRNGYAPSFIRSQMQDACDDMTVEKRLQSRKSGVQRSHGYMDRNFARK